METGMIGAPPMKKQEILDSLLTQQRVSWMDENGVWSDVPVSAVLKVAREDLWPVLKQKNPPLYGLIRLNTIERIVARTGANASTSSIVTPHFSGDEYFRVLDERIRKAKSGDSIDIHIFEWNDDATGNYLAEQLVEAHTRGVQVHVTVDLAGCLLFGSKKKMRWWEKCKTMFSAALAFLGSVNWRRWHRLLGMVRGNSKVIEQLPPEEIQAFDARLRKAFDDKYLLSMNDPLQTLQTTLGSSLKIVQRGIENMDHSKIIRFTSTDASGKKTVRKFLGGRNIGIRYSGNCDPQKKDPRERWSGGPDMYHDYSHEVLLQGDDAETDDLLAAPRKSTDPVLLPKRTSSDVFQVLSNSNDSGEEPEKKQITYAMKEIIRGAKHTLHIEHAFIHDEELTNLLIDKAKSGLRIYILHGTPEGAEFAEMEEDSFRKIDEFNEKMKEKNRATLENEFGFTYRQTKAFLKEYEHFLDGKRKHEHWKNLKGENNMDDAIFKKLSPMIRVYKAKHTLHSKCIVSDMGWPKQITLGGSANLTGNSKGKHGEQGYLMMGTAAHETGDELLRRQDKASIRGPVQKILDSFKGVKNAVKKVFRKNRVESAA